MMGGEDKVQIGRQKPRLVMYAMTMLGQWPTSGFGGIIGCKTSRLGDDPTS